MRDSLLTWAILKVELLLSADQINDCAPLIDCPSLEPAFHCQVFETRFGCIDASGAVNGSESVHPGDQMPIYHLGGPRLCPTNAEARGCPANYAGGWSPIAKTIILPTFDGIGSVWKRDGRDQRTSEAILNPKLDTSVRNVTGRFSKSCALN
jgi:hypothetical protein